MRGGRSRWWQWAGLWGALGGVLWGGTVAAWAGGPRFVAGTTYAKYGYMMAFYTETPTYWTDAGTLSATLTHAQSDALVAAAAGVWNVPTANLTLGQGGVLAEHVSGANTYFDGSTVVFPADVQATNYESVPIAVIYDTDGSVTDLLLGSGASDPSGCRQNGVTESVDGFGQDATLHHALIVLNGRCVGSNSEQLLQMQYQVMRAFGRVLGLAWSQCNDNVFTGASPVTAEQMAYWPVMHPMDVVCGLYTYQCMQNPFVLRADDVSALALLYPVTAGKALPGKTVSVANGASVTGTVSFSNGQGMELVNLGIVRSWFAGVFEGWQTASAVSGVLYQQNGGNPVSGAESAAENVGTPFGASEAYFATGSVPLTAAVEQLDVVPEAINPLYTGEYSIGPYERPPTGLAAGAPVGNEPFVTPGTAQAFGLTMSNEPASCAASGDGTESAPAASDPSGWWTNVLCGTGHSSWWSTTVKAGTSWTVEATALDESGAATLHKLQPVLGVWNSGDATGTLPTVASQAVAMNSLVAGVTQLRVGAATVAGSYRVVVADQFGGGRPDFAYQVRVLRADSVTPTEVPVGGGQIVVTGTGFKPGNEVLVNGVRAVVTSWSSTQIVATAPTAAAAGAGSSAADVEVLDATTGGVTDISGALSYSSAVSAVGPAAQVVVMSGAAQHVAVGGMFSPLMVQVQDSHGNGVADAAVSVYQTVYAWEGACPALGPCAAAPVLKTSQTTLVSGAGGMVLVTPLQVSGQAQVVDVGVAAGASGFVSVELEEE